MDTSKEYIKMCRKAEEVQELWEPIPGDFAYDIRYKDPIIIINYDKNTYIYGFNLVNELEFEECVLYFNSENDLIWLPRQDQLQDMVYKTSDHPYTLIAQFFDFVHTDDMPMKTSMEQLWLRYVMHEKFNKVWDGKEWATQNS